MPNSQDSRREVYDLLVRFQNCCNRAVRLVTGMEVDGALLRDLRASSEAVRKPHGLEVYLEGRMPANANMELHLAVKDHLG
jgi:hypothetical protein